LMSAPYRAYVAAFLTRLQRTPHRGFPSSAAQSLARFVAHRDGDVGVHKPRRRLQAWACPNQGLDDGTIAKQDEFGVGMTDQRKLGARHGYRRPAVTAHRIQRNPDLLGHLGALAGVLQTPDRSFGSDKGATIACRRPETTTFA